MISIEEVNEMNFTDFISYFGNIIQSAGWLSSAVWSCRPFKSANELQASVCRILDHLPLEVKEATLRGLPELGRKQPLSRECTQEQQSAGLSTLSDEKQALIERLNNAYTTKFGFPFIVCARENKVDSILQGLMHRVKNSREQEVENAINEVKKICWLRLYDIIYLPNSVKCRL